MTAAEDRGVQVEARTLSGQVEDVVADYGRVWPVPYELSANLRLLVHVNAALVTLTDGGAPS